MVYFRPNLTELIEPLLGDDWKKTKIELPFHGLTKHAYPEVKFLFHFNLFRYE